MPSTVDVVCWTGQRGRISRSNGLGQAATLSQAHREMNYVSSAFPHSRYSHAFWFRNTRSTESILLVERYRIVFLLNMFHISK